MTEKLVPKLRFKEFTDEWTTSQLKDICNIQDGTHSTPNYVDKGVPFFSVDTIINNAPPKFISEIDHKKLIKRCHPKKGDILLSRITGGILGYPKIIDWDYEFSIYVSLALLSDIKINSEYLEYYIRTPIYHNDLLKKSLLLAVPPKINLNDLKSTKLTYPSVKEQKEISSFLTKVDDKIKLLKQKYKKCQEFKTYLMQNIFSQKLRFDNFEEKWKTTKLGKVVDFLDNRRIPLNEEERKAQDNVYPYYGASGIIDYVENYIFDEELILLGEDGTIDVTLANGKYWVNNHAHVLKAKNNINQYLLAEYLKTIHFEKYNTGTIQPKLNKETCKTISITIPRSIEEQNKIAEFLFTIDKKISTIQIEKNHLEDFKKGLLQSLFFSSLYATITK